MTDFCQDGLHKGQVFLLVNHRKRQKSYEGLFELPNTLMLDGVSKLQSDVTSSVSKC